MMLGSITNFLFAYALYFSSTQTNIYAYKIYLSGSRTFSLPTRSGSAGVETLISYLNGEGSRALLSKLTMSDATLKEEMQKANFWSGGNFVVEHCTCTGITAEGIVVQASCQIKGKSQQMRTVVVPFPRKVDDETMLKTALIVMACNVGRLQETADIIRLPFGRKYEMPLDFRFNNVPHSTWVRSYLYEAAVDATMQVVKDKSISNKSYLQMKVNYPEVNPAFDTYRIGTIIEMVRSMALALAEEEGLRVRVCVQQPLGEGIFVGMPLALASMRVVLEKMDWGQRLLPEQKFRPSDITDRRSEALIRIGSIGAAELADDDDVVLIIAPQNVIGGMIVDKLEEMVVAAKGRPVILVNPNLMDRPSSNNMMQIRGRAERRTFVDSFKDFYALRLLYPSSGGYMFPISGMIAKQDYHSPWVAYGKEEDEKGRELYRILAAFDPYTPPDPSLLSSLFTRK